MRIFASQLADSHPREVTRKAPTSLFNHCCISASSLRILSAPGYSLPDTMTDKETRHADPRSRPLRRRQARTARTI